MTYEIDLILTRLNQSFLAVESYGPTMKEGSFHGPSLMDAVYSVPYNKINVKPIRERHSTWEILNHCQYWMEAAETVLTGEKMPDIQDLEDWPTHESTLDAWKEDIRRINRAHQSLTNSVKQLDESTLNDEIQSSFHGDIFTYTYRKLLHGIADHNIYHAGQISLIK